MVDFLREEGLALRHVNDYPDYYSSRPGGRIDGRSVEALLLDGKALGADYRRLAKRNFMPALAIRAQDLSGVSNGIRTWSSLLTNVAMVWRTLKGLLTGRGVLGMGQALVGELVLATQRHAIPILTETPLLRLLTDDDGAVTGAVVRHEGRETSIMTRRAVVLASGGFSRNPSMRRQYQPQVAGDWTHSSLGDEGDGIRAGLDVGAAVEQMDEAWWMPTSVMADGSRHMCAWERCKPHSIMVDSTGARWCDESGSYMEIGRLMLDRQATLGSADPFWLVIDARHRRRYPFATWPAGFTPRSAFTTGYMIKAPTLTELARRCHIDESGLLATVDRYNRMCEKGIDDDFHRGDDAFGRYYGDIRIAPKPTMGALEKAPFYAVAVYPGDIGTNGGLLTDENARVLRTDGNPIAGLYATGNCTASVMGRMYPGAGATIAPAMVFGYVAANHALGDGRIG
jgi:3-oxosteroid 1-dehydrogenase